MSISISQLPAISRLGEFCDGGQWEIPSVTGNKQMIATPSTGVGCFPPILSPSASARTRINESTFDADRQPE